MSAGKEEVPPYTLTFGLDLAADIAADAVDPAALNAVQAILDDRQVDERVRDVLAIGLREEHVIYRLAARRIAP